jgi:uncharacterized protein YecE (DUF72 family)
MVAVRRYIGSAGWNIPRVHRGRFDADGSQLQRYASRLNGVEINTSFYRPHAAATYARWAAAVPRGFRFAVKVPKLVTHDRALLRAREPMLRFLDEIGGLGDALGPLLVQLPPSFAFDSRRVGRFFNLVRTLHRGALVCEPRHATWAAPAVDALLASFRVARVAADPPRGAGLETPGGFRALAYYRWHGSPRPYFSPYEAPALDRLAAAIGADRDAREIWCMFDNTGSGAAAGNALDLAGRFEPAAADSTAPLMDRPAPADRARGAATARRRQSPARRSRA